MALEAFCDIATQFTFFRRKFNFFPIYLLSYQNKSNQGISHLNKEYEGLELNSTTAEVFNRQEFEVNIFFQSR